MSSSRRSKSPAPRETLAPGAFGAPNVRLVRKIAEGGMGSVWEGDHLGLKTNVAVKFVLGELGDNEEALTRFAREATATARIKSPHVVQVFDHGKNEEGFPYMVMEFLEGEDLEARLEREGKLPSPLVFQIVLQAAKALAKAHDLGIVHRDMKPSNVFLTDLEGEVFVKILDFGIAKMSNDDLLMSMTQTGAVIGTPYFMAPEQMTSAKDAGPPSDVWSLGVIAYRALTGRLPYESETLAGLAMAIERGNFPAPSTLVEGLPAGVDEWFKRAIAKDPADRFATVREMAEELGKIVRAQMGHHVYTSSSPPPSLRSPSERKPTAPSEVSPASARPLAEATTLAVPSAPSRPLTEMSSTKALSARQSRGSSIRLVLVGAVATIIGSLGAYLYVSTQRSQATTEASASVTKPEKSSAPKPAKPAVPEVATSEPTPDASASAELSPSAEPAGSAEEPAASASAAPSASAPPSAPKGQLPKPPPPKPSASASAAPSAKPSASASAAPSAKPSASAAPAPKPSATAPAKPAPSAAK